MDQKKRIGLRIRELRKAEGWSQELLAEKIGRSAETISHLERGLSYPKLESVIRLAAAFKMSVGDIIDPVTDPHAEPARAKLLTDVKFVLNNMSNQHLETALSQLKALADHL